MNIGADCWRVAHVRRTGLATYPRGARLGPRTIPDRELAWIIEGEATIAYGDVHWRVRPGDLAFIAPGIVHEFAWNTRGPTRHGYIHFSIAGQAPPAIETPVLRGPDASRLCVLLGHLLVLARRADEGESAAQDLLYQGLSFVLRSFAVESRRAAGAHGALHPPHPAIERAARRIESQRHSGVVPKLTVAGLARHTGVSEAHLNRLVKARLGYSLSALLRHMRLNHAVELLDRTDLSVKEVADAAGYENRFAFSRALSSAFGAAPGELHAALRAGAPRPPPLPELR